jgi:hypothetical protein
MKKQTKRRVAIFATVAYAFAGVAAQNEMAKTLPEETSQINMDANIPNKIDVKRPVNNGYAKRYF